MDHSSSFPRPSRWALTAGEGASVTHLSQWQPVHGKCYLQTVTSSTQPAHTVRQTIVNGGFHFMGASLAGGLGDWGRSWSK
jgi:hypothetical protein